MPYKTRYGSHYHMEEGCHGAKIPCGTEGLEPCSDCCGTKAGGGGTVPQDGGTGAVTGGSSGAELYDVPTSSETPMQQAEPADGKNESPQSAREYLVALAEKQPTNEGVTPDPDSMAVSNVDVQEMPLFVPPNQNSGDTSQNVTHEKFSIADNGEVIREPPSPEGSAPDPSVMSDAPDGMPIFTPPGASTGKPPSSPAEAETEYLAGNGKVQAGTEDSVARARATIEKLDNVIGLRLGTGREDEARAQISTIIDSRADGISDSQEREAFRKAAQERWNELHPDAKVLVWSRTDEGYVADTERSVLQRKRNYSEMRSFAAGGTAYVGYDYSIKSKATGEDITEQVANANADLRITNAAINRLEEKARARGRAEVAQQERGLFRDWLEEKQQTSKDWRYHRGVYNPDTIASLRREFREETGYKPPKPQMRPTDEEQELMRNLNAQLAKATNDMDNLVLEHGISDQMVSAVAPKSLWIPGELTGDRGRRIPV